MIHLSVVFLFLTTTVFGIEGRELRPVTEVFSHDGKTIVDLRVQESQVSVPLRGFGKGAVFMYTGRLYVYKGVALIPGPVIHARPGGELVLRIVNDLGDENHTEVESDMYTLHGANTTNVHFHGIHADPAVDDVFKRADPGHSLIYRLKIPLQHLPGLHWYHTHAHGSSYLLLMGGLFGPLIIDYDAGNNINNNNNDNNNKGDGTSSLPSYVLMVHLYRLRSSTLCDGMPMDSVEKAIGTNMFSRPRIVKGDGEKVTMPSDLFLVNGQHQPTVRIEEGKPTLLRIVFAAGSCHLNISFPKECRFYIVAIDGVPLEHEREVKNKWLYFTAASRYDVVAVCETTRAGKEIPVVLVETAEVIFLIHVDTVVRDLDKDYSKHAFPVYYRRHTPKYLNTLGPKIMRDISFSQMGLSSSVPHYVIGQGSDCSSLLNSTTCYSEHFMGRKGWNRDLYRGFTLPLNSVIEARVFGDPMDITPHPLHLHVNHFVFVGFVARKGGQHENISMADFGVFPGDIRDVIPILDGVTVIRWRAASYTGEVVFHCHTLSHSDRGMMNSYLVHSAGSLDKKDGTRFNSVSSKSDASENQYIFLFLSIVFFLSGLLCAVFGWLRNNHSCWEQLVCDPGKIWASSTYRSFEGDDLERQHLERRA